MATTAVEAWDRVGQRRRTAPTGSYDPAVAALRWCKARSAQHVRNLGCDVGRRGSWHWHILAERRRTRTFVPVGHRVGISDGSKIRSAVE
jgi:hypothetical protein